MGWENLVYQNQHVSVRDSDLILLQHFLLETLQNTPANQLSTDLETLVALTEYLSSWQRIGPGVVDGIDPAAYISQNDHRQKVLLRLLHRTSDAMHEFGQEIPAEYVSRHFRQLGYREVSLPVATVTAVIAKFCQLLALAKNKDDE